MELEPGARVQLVASSVVGKWGAARAAAAWQLLDSGRVDMLASDSHHARSGGLHLSAALEMVGAGLGRKALYALTEQGPAELICRPLHSS